MSLIGKIRYLRTQTLRRLMLNSTGCPNCGDTVFLKIDQKYIVTELRECVTCRLMYRYPTDSIEHNSLFYQNDYQQGFTTELPNEQHLEKLLKTKFYNHEKSYSDILSLIDRLGIHPGSALFDYGCSWGYGSWQFLNAGYKVKAFELSKVRGKFASEKMGVHVHTNFDDMANDPSLDGAFDIFFSNHVIEHVPQPRTVIELARRLLKPKGYFVAVTPNGSLGYRDVDAKSWSMLWGEVHPNLINDQFWHVALEGESHFVGSFPASVGALSRWIASGEPQLVAQQDSELLCVAQF